MKPPTSKEKPDTTGDDLLKKLDGTPPGSLKAGIAQVEGLSKSDEENHGRWLKSVRKKIVNKLVSWFLHFLFFVVCIIVLFVVAGTLVLTFIWVKSFVSKPDQVAEFLLSVWNLGLVALATLFIQNIWPKE